MAIYSDLNQKNVETKELVIDVASVEQSINNILTTSQMTRFFNPEFGTELGALLFELNDHLTTTRVETWVVNVIERWEPRVEIIESSAKLVPDEHLMIINLSYKILGLSDREFNYTTTLTM